MGGKNIYKFTKACFKHKTNFRDLRNNIYVVDMTYQLNRIMRGLGNKNKESLFKLHNYLSLNKINNANLYEYECSVSHMIAVCSFVDMCIDRRIKIIPVLDGYAHKLKSSRTNYSGNRNRNTSGSGSGNKNDDGNDNDNDNHDGNDDVNGNDNGNDNGDDNNDNNDNVDVNVNVDGNEDNNNNDNDKSKDTRNNIRTVANTKKKQQYNFRLDYAQINDVHYLLDAMGLPHVQSFGEADGQCAGIAMSDENISGIISEDSDILLYGGQKLIKNLNRKSSEYDEIELDDVLTFLTNKANKIKPTKKFTRNNLIDMSILNGTDYNQPIFQRDPELNFEQYVAHNMSVSEMLNNIGDAKNKDINLEIYKKVKSIYTDVCIINPSKLDLTFKRPNYEKMENILCNKYKFKQSYVNKLFQKLKYL